MSDHGGLIALQCRGRLSRWPYRLYNRLSELTYGSLGIELPGVHRCALFLADKVLSIVKARAELGCRPAVSLEKGMIRSIRWDTEQGLL